MQAAKLLLGVQGISFIFVNFGPLRNSVWPLICSIGGIVYQVKPGMHLALLMISILGIMSHNDEKVLGKKLKLVADFAYMVAQLGAWASVMYTAGVISGV